MNCPWSSTRWMRASISRLSARYCALMSVNSMGAHLALELFNFLLDRLVLLDLASQEARRGADLFPRALRRQVIRVGELVVAVAKIAHLDEAPLEQRAQAEVDLANAHAELPGELALRELGVRCEQLQQPVAGLIVEHREGAFID